MRDFTLSPPSLFIDTLQLAGDEGDRSRQRHQPSISFLILAKKPRCLPLTGGGSTLAASGIGDAGCR